jgi:hypothetical protein
MKKVILFCFRLKLSRNKDKRWDKNVLNVQIIRMKTTVDHKKKD